MKRTFTLLLIYLFSFVTGQTYECGFDEVHQQKLQNPIYASKVLEFEQNVQLFRRNPMLLRSADGVSVIPVVVHVMQEGTMLTEITQDEVRKQIQVINERMRKITGTVGDGAGVDVKLEFSLAVQDPNGNATDGINYINVTNSAYVQYGVDRSSGQGISDQDLKDLSRWDTNKYYNIWLVSEIDNNNGGSGVAGYAYFSGSHGSSYDGAVIHTNAFRNEESSPTTTHELGHAFNLYHTFQGSSGGDCPPAESDCTIGGDKVCDTPRHPKNFNCGESNSCGGGNLVATNYMSYASGYCQNMFTDGQKDRMLVAMTNDRSSFLPSAGNVSLVPVEAPVANFVIPSQTSCVGSTFQFYDKSQNVPNTFLAQTDWPNITFAWTITKDGEFIESNNNQNPEFTFNTAGDYAITLSVTNQHGTDSITKNINIVNPSTVSVCEPTSYNSSGNYLYTINNVSFNTINNSTSDRQNGVYEDFSCSSATTVAPNRTYELGISVRSRDQPFQYEVYIDYNNNGQFEHPDEMVANGQGVIEENVTQNHNVTIPEDAVENTLLRMRVISDIQAITDAKRNCTSSFLVGDAEDYGVFIKSQSQCYQNPIVDASVEVPSHVGISSLDRSMVNEDNWPMVRQSGYLVLESKTKGFVLNRLNSNQLQLIVDAGHAVEGMMVYNTGKNCLSIYTNANGWKCFNKPACPSE